MRKVWCLLLWFCCLSLLTNSAFSADNQLPIGSISTVGNRTVSDTQILSKVRSRVGQLFNPAVAAEDVKRVTELPGVDHAYYHTTIAADKIGLTFVVVEQNVVRTISFVGNRKYKAKNLQKKVSIKRGDYLDRFLAQAGRKTLIEFYHKKGYGFVQISLDNEQLSQGKVIYRIDEGPRVKIASVRFSGNKAVKTRALKKVVKTSKRKFFVLPRYYAEEQTAKDVAKLQKVYYERGFLDSSIVLKRQFNKDKSRVRLTFVIEEGAAYTVERIVLAGMQHFGDERLRTELKLKQGQIYNERKAVSDVKRLLKLYRENGFIDADVQWSRKYISEDRVRIEIGITEGDRFRIGKINITGNEQTQDKVVRRVLDEYDFQPGKWYNADTARGDGSGQLEKTAGRMIYAQAGSTTITPTGKVPGRSDALVSIAEGQTGSVMLGAGVASDSGVIGQLVFEQRNFDIKDTPESFYEFITGRAFKGAGQNLRISLQPGTEVSDYSISFTEPYLKDKPISLNVVASVYERFFESYDEGRIRGHVGFEKRYKNHWRKSIGFRVEDVDISDIDTDAPREIKEVKGGNALAGVKVGLSRDFTNDRFNPSSGYNFSTSYEQVGGEHTFGILSGVYRRYKVLYEDLAERETVLAFKLLGATTIGDAPPFEKFYAGGTGLYSIRGFDYRGVSTRGLPTDSAGVPIPGREKDDPIGSYWIVLANAEVAVPLVGETLSALFFVDSGTIDSGSYRVSAGAGIEIMLPHWFGPVPMRFTFAAPLTKNDGDETQVFSFSVGRLF